MSSSTQRSRIKPIIVVGSGLAGLACARTLQKLQIPFLILEKESEVGGKLKTLVTAEGFRLDHGFQVLLTSYPELKNFLNLKDLKLKPFNSGSLIYVDGKVNRLANPILHPQFLLSEVFSSFISFKDKALTLKLIVVAQGGISEEIKKISTIDFLKNFGFSLRFIDIFWKPFLTGVFLDPKLSLTADFFLFLINQFSSGRVAVPELGMQEIPRQMAQSIDPSSIRFNSAVSQFAADHVVLASGEKIFGERIVVAHNPSKNSADYHGVENYYFTTAENLTWGSWLVLVPASTGLSISTIAVMNSVSSAYSSKPNIKLLSVSIVGGGKLASISIEKIQNELRKISGLVLSDLKFIEKYQITTALPKLISVNKSGYEIKNDIFYCGDWAVSPSTNGALMSGRLVAEKIAADLKNEPMI